MTCIVGVRHENGVLLAGDSLGVSGYSSTVRSDPKVFRLTREVACGFTSSFRMGQILRFHVTPPAITGDEYAWAVTEFVPVIRAAFRDHGFAEIHNNEESAGTFLLAVRRRLFKVEGDYQIGEPAPPFDAVGCGDDYAMGAMHALTRSKIHRSKITDRELLRAALDAASEFSIGVRGPYTFASTTR